MFETDFRTSPEKLFPYNISSIIALAVPIFSGSSPGKLFLVWSSTDRLNDSKRGGRREPENLLSERIMQPRFISARHREGNFLLVCSYLSLEKADP